MQRKLISAAVMVVLLLGPTACSGDDDDDGDGSSTATTTTVATTAVDQTTTTTQNQTNGPDTSEPTAELCDRSWDTQPETLQLEAASPAGYLTSIRTGQHACFDRVAFDFANAAGSNGVGSFEVRYADQVVSDGTGDTVPLEGEADLQVLIRGLDQPATASSLNTVDRQVEWRALRDVKYGSHFEGIYVIGIGVSQELPFRVGRADDNTLFVDILHPG
jgi:hypothetical protein